MKKQATLETSKLEVDPPGEWVSEGVGEWVSDTDRGKWEETLFLQLLARKNILGLNFSPNGPKLMA